jgi:acetyl-CoA C-acetyltransferase
MVGYPYTRTMVAVMDVDMAAAVIVASWEAADRLGVPVDRRVAVRGWAYATDPIYVAEHADLGRSPAMAAATRAALVSAGVGADDVACFDLYSCFASSVDFARDALGISVADSRALTVTGGLPYAGGPGSNYGSHALTSMVRRLREEPGAVGMTTGVGMHMTKHAATVLSTDPGSAASIAPVDGAELQARVDASNELKSITDTFEGGATVAAYSVVHGRDGSPEWGLAVCDLPDGTRSYGRVEDPDLLVDWESTEWVGATVRSTVDGAVNRLSA